MLIDNEANAINQIGATIEYGALDSIALNLKRIRLLRSTIPILVSLRLAYREIKQYFTTPTKVSARLTYSEI